MRYLFLKFHFKTEYQVECHGPVLFVKTFCRTYLSTMISEVALLLSCNFNFIKNTHIFYFCENCGVNECKCIKFRYFEKARKFEKNLPPFQIFVAFSQYLNFSSNDELIGSNSQTMTSESTKYLTNIK